MQCAHLLTPAAAPLACDGPRPPMPAAACSFELRWSRGQALARTLDIALPGTFASSSAAYSAVAKLATSGGDGGGARHLGGGASLPISGVSRTTTSFPAELQSVMPDLR